MVQTFNSVSKKHEKWLFNPLSPTGDLERISPYTISMISSRQVMRKKKNINEGIIYWSNSKFSKLTSYELYGTQ